MYVKREGAYGLFVFYSIENNENLRWPKIKKLNDIVTMRDLFDSIENASYFLALNRPSSETFSEMIKRGALSIGVSFSFNQPIEGESKHIDSSVTSKHTFPAGAEQSFFIKDYVPPWFLDICMSDIDNLKIKCVDYISAEYPIVCTLDYKLNTHLLKGYRKAFPEKAFENIFPPCQEKKSETELLASRVEDMIKEAESIQLPLEPVPPVAPPSKPSPPVLRSMVINGFTIFY